MSIKLMSEVWTLQLDHARQSVMLALADHADDSGGSIFPSMAYVAWKTGYSERQVKRIMHDLVSDGLLTPADENLGGRGRANEYTMHIEKGVKKASFSEIRKGVKRRIKGDIQSVKGDKSDVKHDIAMSPQSSVEPLEEPPKKSSEVSSRVPRSPDTKKMNEDEFLVYLKAEPAYKHINIDWEAGKMRKWCGERNKQPTRRRFINWLNNIEPPMEGNGNGGNGKPQGAGESNQTETRGGGTRDERRYAELQRQTPELILGRATPSVVD